VRAGLPLCFVSQPPESADQFHAVAIARNFHEARTSSRT
jgi:hypothetical protein